MSNLRADTLKNQSGTDGPTFEGDLNFPATSAIILPKGTTAERPVGVPTGFLRYNTTDSLVEYWDGTTWSSVNTFDPSSYRGVFGGGNTNTLDYITLVSLGNATDFGDLTSSRTDLAACSSSTRGVFGGGGPFSGNNTIDYITIATTGNATDFGDLTVARRGPAACSSSTRGIFAGGYAPPAPYNLNVIDYITIATTGNATDFGDLTAARHRLAACSSSTRGVFGGGTNTPSPTPAFNTIDYITIATTGSATNFGDLTVARFGLAACSSSTRGVFGGGSSSPARVNSIDYITIATTGDATDFGDLTIGRQYLAACSSSKRGVFGGGYTPTPQNTIDYITIATTGDATDFGDLTVARYGLAACSNNHGGLS